MYNDGLIIKVSVQTGSPVAENLACTFKPSQIVCEMPYDTQRLHGLEIVRSLRCAITCIFDMMLML